MSSRSRTRRTASASALVPEPTVAAETAGAAAVLPGTVPPAVTTTRAAGLHTALPTAGVATAAAPLAATTVPTAAAPLTTRHALGRTAAATEAALAPTGSVSRLRRRIEQPQRVLSEEPIDESLNPTDIVHESIDEAVIEDAAEQGAEYGNQRAYVGEYDEYDEDEAMAYGDAYGYDGYVRPPQVSRSGSRRGRATAPASIVTDPNTAVSATSSILPNPARIANRISLTAHNLASNIKRRVVNRVAATPSRVITKLTGITAEADELAQSYPTPANQRLTFWSHFLHHLRVAVTLLLLALIFFHIFFFIWNDRRQVSISFLVVELHTSVGFLILCAMFYGVIFSSILFYLRQLSLYAETERLQVALTEAQEQLIAYERLKLAAQQIYVPMALDALVERGFQDFSTAASGAANTATATPAVTTAAGRRRSVADGYNYTEGVVRSAGGLSRIA